MDTSEQILSVLDRCCEEFSFATLDHGYVFMAATRLSLFRSRDDWAIVIEIFGFNPRSGRPGIDIHTYSNRLHNRDVPDTFADREAYENYLEYNPFNEFRNAWPIDEGNWEDPEDLELVADGAGVVHLRGRPVDLPPTDAYEAAGVEFEEAPRIAVFELCRYLAHVRRDEVLATPQERRVSVGPELELLLTLDEWNHPDIAGDELPSGSETFQQLAQVLETGDVGAYEAAQAPNTHWKNWPDGGWM